MSAESLTEHIKRRAAVLAERFELELSVAGTEYAPLERAIFKATKNNTKVPKEKHVIALHRAVSDGDSGKTILKMLVRRLKEVGQERISSGSFAVWHRCLNSGDNSFIQLCSQYVHVLEPPAQNPLALMYGAYIRELLQAFSKCNHAYQRETDYEDSKIVKLSQVDLIAHIPPLLKQLNKLLECDLQGGLMDGKTRCSVQYVINLLVLDSIPLFKAVDLAMDRIRDCVGTLGPEDAERMAAMYGRYVKMPERLLLLLKQANTERDVSVPLTAFDTKALRAFKTRLEAVQTKLRKEGYDYDTVKALAEVAVQRSNDDPDDLPLKAIATFSLDEIEADQVPSSSRTGGGGGGGGGDLLDLSSPSEDLAKPQSNGHQELWDPFNDLASQNSAPSASHQANPFAAPPTSKAGAGLIDFDLAPAVGTITGDALKNLYSGQPAVGSALGGAQSMAGGIQGLGSGMGGIGGAQTMGGGMQGFGGGMGGMGGAQTMGAGMQSGMKMGMQSSNQTAKPAKQDLSDPFGDTNPFA